MAFRLPHINIAIYFAVAAYYFIPARHQEASRKSVNVTQGEVDTARCSTGHDYDDGR